MKKRNQNKRKDRNSSENEGGNVPKQATKQSKLGSGPNDSISHNISVSEILNQTNTVLYETNDQLNNSVFEDSLSKDETVNIRVQKTKMASGDSLTSTVNNDPTISNKLDTVINAIKDIKINQDGMKRMFESKLDKLRKDLLKNVDEKIQSLRDEISLDLGTETRRVDEVMTTIQSIQTRLSGVEQRNQTVSDDGTVMNTSITNPLDCTDLTVTASGIPISENDDLMQKANDVINSLGTDVSSNVQVIAVTRLPNRFNNRPGLVKISFRNKEEKILVLKNKMKLKENDEFKKVFIKSSKSRVERLIERNTRSILKIIPQADTLRIDANGMIRPKLAHQSQTTHS